MRKKILLVTPFFSGVGGVESSLNTLATILRRRGWDVDVLSLPKLPDGLYEKIEKRPYISFFILILPLILKGLFNFRRYSCIHGAGMAGGYVAHFISMFKRIPYVVSTHAIYKGIRDLNFIEINILKKAKVVLCLSEDSEKEIRSYGIKNTKVYRTLIDWEVFKPLNIPKINKGLFVARPIAKKGWDVVKKIPNVIMLSGVDNKFMPYYYNVVDYTLTAAQYAECFSRVILESLFCDTPVIASNKDVAINVIPSDVVTFCEPTEEEIKKAIKKLVPREKGFYRKYAIKEFGEKNIEVFENAYLF